jgi:uncharacterized RDD family membrane protein YckC
MDNPHYGSLITRVKGILVDFVILMGLGIFASTMLARFEPVSNAVRIIVFLLVFFLYDPVTTSAFGGTIGHYVMGLRVRRNDDETKNISLPVALIRYFAKIFLGAISLITVSGNKKNRAIHDSIAGSVVIQT